MSCGMKGPGMTGQSLVDRGPIFDGGHRPRKTVLSRKSGVYRPTKKHLKPKWL